MNWTELFLGISSFIKKKSKDKRRKVGCIIVDDRNVPISFGWNGFPRGINDEVESRHKRPEKYKWTEHAERNAIYNAASKVLFGSTIYLTLFPCCECARGIIQTGIKKIVCMEKPNFKDSTYGEDFKISLEMLNEAKIEITFATEDDKAFIEENLK